MMDHKSRKRLSVLKAKNTGKKYKDIYLRELKQLVIPDLDENQLLQLEKTLEIPKVEGNVEKHYFPFSKKKAVKKLFEKLISIKDGEVFLITQYSLFCGALVLKSLEEFNVYFKFEAEHQGLIQLRLVDITNELILDFYEENGERKIEIEIVGRDWPVSDSSSYP